VTSLFLWDDARARRFAPYALTRPASELRAGAMLGRERWERLLGVRAAGFVAGAHLAGFDEAGAPRAVDTVPAGAVLANSRCLPALDVVRADDADAWSVGGRVGAVRLARDVTAAELAETPDLTAFGAAAEVETVVDVAFNPLAPTVMACTVIERRSVVELEPGPICSTESCPPDTPKEPACPSNSVMPL
jgi:hypothetical protein